MWRAVNRHYNKPLTNDIFFAFYRYLIDFCCCFLVFSRDILTACQPPNIKQRIIINIRTQTHTYIWTDLNPNNKIMLFNSSLNSGTLHFNLTPTIALSDQHQHSACWWQWQWNQKPVNMLDCWSTFFLSLLSVVPFIEVLLDEGDFIFCNWGFILQLFAK